MCAVTECTWNAPSIRRHVYGLYFRFADANPIGQILTCYCSSVNMGIPFVSGSVLGVDERVLIRMQCHHGSSRDLVDGDAAGASRVPSDQ